MNDNRSEMYSINSGYYDLPVKEPWVCGKTLYSVITISSAVLVGVAAACFFAPWLFGNTTLTATGITLIGAYYAIFAIFAPFIGTNILRPVSIAGARINVQAEQLNAAIKKLAECDLIIRY